MKTWWGPASGPDNAKWKGGPVEVVCAHCRLPFLAKRNGDKTKRFCSRLCGDKGGGRRRKEPIPLRRITQTCGWCGAKFEIYPSRVNKKKFCQPECHHRWRSAWLSDKANGRTKREYPLRWPRMRRKIVDRDGARCRNPLCWGTGRFLQVHHIDHDKTNDDPLNLVTICSSCNMRANYNRPFWRAHYERIVSDYGMLKEGR